MSCRVIQFMILGPQGQRYGSLHLSSSCLSVFHPVFARISHELRARRGTSKVFQVARSVEAVSLMIALTKCTFNPHASGHQPQSAQFNYGSPDLLRRMGTLGV